MHNSSSNGGRNCAIRIRDFDPAAVSINANTVTSEDTDPPPNGGYGWVCVACCFCIQAHSWGLLSAYAVFLAYYLSTDAFGDASKLDFTFIGGLTMSQAFLVAPVATVVTRSLGTRTTLLIGAFLQTLGFLGASFAKQIWQLFLSEGICFGWGLGFLFIGSVGIVLQWFTTRRSLANGIASAGTGVGGLIYSLAAEAMIYRISLGWTYRILGIVSCTVNFTCAMLLRDRNKQIGSNQHAFNYRMLKRLDFALVLGWAFLSLLGFMVLIFSLPAYATSIGLTTQQGSVVGALLNLGQAFGRPAIGYLSDTMGRINMATAATFLAGIFALVIWVFAKTYSASTAISDGLDLLRFDWGTVMGTFWATIAPVCAEVAGLQQLPSALSVTWVAILLPALLAEPIAFEIVANNGGRYIGAQLFTGFMYIGAAIFLWYLQVSKRSQYH